MSARVRRLPCKRQSLSAMLSLSSRRMLQLSSWHKRLPSAMPSLSSCAPSSRALPRSARAQASARRLRPVRMRRRKTQSSSVRLTTCARSWDARMTKPNLPRRRRAMLLKTICPPATLRLLSYRQSSPLRTRPRRWRLPLPRQSRSVSSMPLAARPSARLLTIARRYKRSFPPQRLSPSKRPRACVPSCANRS